MSYQELKSHIFAGIDKNHDNLAALNDDLADHPEISGQEFQTSRKIVKLLESYGYLTEYPYAGLETAFRAISGSNDHTYKIAIMTRCLQSATPAGIVCPAQSAFWQGFPQRSCKMNWMQIFIS